jgi:hypothetical protein
MTFLNQVVLHEVKLKDKFRTTVNTRKPDNPVFECWFFGQFLGFSFQMLCPAILHSKTRRFIQFSKVKTSLDPFINKLGHKKIMPKRAGLVKIRKIYIYKMRTDSSGFWTAFEYQTIRKPDANWPFENQTSTVIGCWLY